MPACLLVLLFFEGSILDESTAVLAPIFGDRLPIFRHDGACVGDSAIVASNPSKSRWSAWRLLYRLVQQWRIRSGCTAQLLRSTMSGVHHRQSSATLAPARKCMGLANRVVVMERKICALTVRRTRSWTAWNSCPGYWSRSVCQDICLVVENNESRSSY